MSHKTCFRFLFPLPHSVQFIYSVLLIFLCITLVINRPFPSSLVPLFQNECEIFHMKIASACSFIFMQIKVMVSHLDSL